MAENDQHQADETDSIVSNVHFCPTCKKPLRRIVGVKGPFWGCTGYPECKTTRYDVDGHPSDEADEHYRCPVCTRSMIRTRDEMGDYWFCTGYNKGCKVTLRDDGGKPEQAYRCRSCGKLLARRRGKNGMFWGCTQYPDCTTTYNDKDGKPDFDIFTAE